MAHWIYPANTKQYDVLGAFRCEYAYWPVSSKIVVGDRVYIYLSAPHKQIGFVCETLEIDLDKASVIEKVRPFLKSQETKRGNTKLFMKLRVTSEVALESTSAVGYSLLKENGLNGMLMGPRKLENNPELLDYIQGSL